MDILASLQKQSKILLGFEGLILVGLIGLLDYLTGYEFAFSVFYVLPIVLVTWYANQKLGIALSIASAIVWLLADLAARQTDSPAIVPLWNSLIRLTYFLIITVLLSALKNSTELARTDHLTSAMNSRYFYEIVEMELNRFERNRHPFTVGYIDLDNFKTINDRFGHVVGNEVLIMLVNSARKVIRKSDYIARLGGDEFAVLFPETGEEAARTVISKIQNSFKEAMQEKNLSVTFSVGVLTCEVAPQTTDELIRMADKLMYLVKFDGKNAAYYFTYSG